MTQLLEYPAAGGPGLETNRRGVLVGFGVAAVALGCIVTLITVAGTAWAAVRLAQFPALPRARLAIGLALTAAFFLAVGCGLLWGGVAMIRCRRWVGPVGLATSALWLAVGALIVEMMAVSLATESPAGGMVQWEMAVAIGLMAMIGVALPAAYLLVFTRKGVRQTLEAYHPYPVWTDRYPLPVVVVGTWGLMLGLTTLSGGGQDGASLFGWSAEGWWALGVSAGWAAAMAAAGVACFVRPRLGWWLALIVLTLRVVSLVWTDLAGVANFADLPAEDYAGAMRQWHVERVNRTVLAVGCWVAGVVFLWHARKSFVRPEPVKVATEAMPTATPTPVE